jgi:hypothetical protein
MEYKLMAKCEHCGNEYDKTFEVTFKEKSTSSTASSARSTLLRPNVITAGAKSSATVWKTAAKFFAAPTARGKVAKTGCGIASKPCWNLHGERAAGSVGF